MTNRSPIEVRALGPFAIRRDGHDVALPASRKVRALFAYLALAPRPQTRAHLCELLWEVPNDPRGELRWSLSKIRSLVDEPGHERVRTAGDTVWLDLSGCMVDAIAVVRAIEQGIESLDPGRLRALAKLFAGDFLAGLDLERCPVFDGWLTAQRRRFRSCHVALLEALVKLAADDEAPGLLEQWRAIAPFDRRVHEMLLGTLARLRQIKEGEEHLAATVRLFEGEGLDSVPLKRAWAAARAVAPVIIADDVGEISALAAPRHGSVAVMPFVDRSGAADVRGGTADALAHDVITRLAKLRSLFVIAQGTVFALHERQIGPEEAGRMLNVDYVVSGTLRRRGDRIHVTVELSETRSARIVWTEIFDHDPDDALSLLDMIGDRIVASIASEIETIERNRAILKPPNSLDAWEAHHRGLWHMYRFNQPDNDKAKAFFEMAVRLDPTFARAHAGLSFTHFQNAFQGWADRETEIERAFVTAGQSVMADDRDPAAHWAMGRALWLRTRHEESVVELSHAIELSPNFALGHYTLAFVQAQAGDAHAAIASSDYSRQLSPFDPLLFGMLGARAIALVRLGRFGEAAPWAVKAAARPNAHAHIRAIAAFTLALAGSLDEARTYAAAIHARLPQYRVDDFLRAFRFDAHGAALFREGAKRIGME